MRRRDFLKFLGVSVPAAVVAGKVQAEPIKATEELPLVKNIETGPPIDVGYACTSPVMWTTDATMVTGLATAGTFGLPTSTWTAMEDLEPGDMVVLENGKARKAKS